MASKQSATPGDILGSTAFFSEVLDRPSLDRLAAGLRVARYERGATLIREDDLGASMFVLASGEAEVKVPGPGKGRLVATLKAGDLFGEMSLLTGARRAATVTAKTDVEALEISKAALSPLIAASPDLAERFAAMLGKRQNELDRIYKGNGRWKLPHGPQLSGIIRGFFGGTV